MTSTSHDETSAHAETRRERFGAYFPRVFAFAHATLGDEAAARDVVIETFGCLFAEDVDLPQQQFELLLFATARQVCRERAVSKRPDDGLSAREREIVSLVFDAQLPQGQIAAVLGVKEETLAGALLRALKKLRTRLPATAIAPAA